MSGTTVPASAVPAPAPPGDASPRGASGATAVSGVALFLLGLVATFPEGPPVGEASAERVRSFVGSDDVALRVAVTSGLLAVAALVVFTSCLAGRIRSAQPGSVLAGCVAAGGVLLAVVQLLDIAANGMLRLLPGLIDTDLGEVDDATVVGWYGLTGFTHFLADLQMAPIALVLLGSSLAARRSGLLPRWLSWTGIGIGAAAVLGAVGVGVAWSPLVVPWFTALFGWWLWTLAVAVSAALRWRRTRSAAPSGGSPRAREG